MAADAVSLEDRIREHQRAAFAPRRADAAVPASLPAGPGQGVIGPQGVMIVTVTQTAQPFKEILKRSPDDNVRRMYDEILAEVSRRGMKL